MSPTNKMIRLRKAIFQYATIAFSGLLSTQAAVTTPVDVTITTEVIADSIEAIGANLSTLAGGTNFATNQLVKGSGFEPIMTRKLVRVYRSGSNWFEWDCFGGVSQWNLLWTGWGNGAKIRFYRLVDSAGNALPMKNGSLDVTNAHHVVALGEDSVPTPSSQFPQGGWICNKYNFVGGLNKIRFNQSAADNYYLKSGVNYYYIVKAVDNSGNISDASNEVSASLSTNDNGPHIVNAADMNKVEAGKKFPNDWDKGYMLTVIGGTAPFSFSIIEGALPAGLTLNTSEGYISGVPTITPSNVKVKIKVTDSQGKTDERYFVFNPPEIVKNDADKTAPTAPSGLAISAGKNGISLSWNASPSSDVAYYIVYRSDKPGSQQLERVYLNSGKQLREGDYAFIRLRTNFIDRDTRPPSLAEHWGNDVLGCWNCKSSAELRRVAHSSKPLPSDFVFAGEACLQIKMNQPGPVSPTQSLFYKFQKSGEGQWYSQLRPNAPYRVEFWARQDAGAPMTIKYIMGEEYASVSQSTQFTLTTEWKKYTYDFTSPVNYPTTHQWHMGPGIQIAGQGTMYLDNFILFRNDTPHGNKPFGPHEVSFTHLLNSFPQKGKKPAVRFYPLTFNDASMESQVDMHVDSRYDISWNTETNAASLVSLAQTMEWAYKTGTSPETRVIPYQTLVVDLKEEEWKGLIEYLAEPFDPSKDTPQSKPYAYKRYLYRGVGTPWTDEFREIIIEFGNETWHNGAMEIWDGFGWPNHVTAGGKEYGLFAKYIINETIMKMPIWTSANLDKKIHFMLGAFYNTGENGYAELGARQKANIHYVGHANYVGPTWETGESAITEFNSDGLLETTIGLYSNDKWESNMHKLITESAKTRDLLNGRGDTRYRLAAYEGGPSGYTVGQYNLTSELYGKSVAMTVASLDSWLYCSQNKYIHQCFLGFGSGSGWNSHTLPEAGGFRPHAPWIGMTMRNLYAPVDKMLKVTTTTMPTYNRNYNDNNGIVKQQVIPLTGIYAMQGGTTYSVMVLNRKISGVHDGQDFGDGYTPVTLHLPFDKVSKITCYRLARKDGSIPDPADNNLDSTVVVINSKEIPTTSFTKNFILNDKVGATVKGIPPAGVYLYTFETGSVAISQTSKTMSKAQKSRTMNALQEGVKAALSKETNSLKAPSTFTVQNKNCKSANTILNSTDPISTQNQDSHLVTNSTVNSDSSKRVEFRIVNSGGYMSMNTPQRAIDGTITTWWEPLSGENRWIDFVSDSSDIEGLFLKLHVVDEGLATITISNQNSDGKNYIIDQQTIVGPGVAQVISNVKYQKGSIYRITIDGVHSIIQEIL